MESIRQCIPVSGLCMSALILLMLNIAGTRSQFQPCCIGSSCGACMPGIMQTVCQSDPTQIWGPAATCTGAGDACCAQSGGGPVPTTQNPFGTTLPPWLQTTTPPPWWQQTTTMNPWLTTQNPWLTTQNPWLTTFNPWQTTLFPGQQGVCSARLVRSSSSSFASASGPGVSVFGAASSSDSQNLDQFLREGTDTVFNTNNTSGKHPRAKRIVGGEPTVDGQLCYQVAIFSATTQQLVATGALIADNYVLTSYSSILRADPAGSSLRLILGGRANVSPQMATTPGIATYRVVRVVPHPNFMQRYGPGFPINDVALLQIDTTSQPVTPTTVCKLCLAPVIPELRRVFVSGYGSTAENSQVSDGVLRRVTVPLIPKPVCQNVFKTIFPANFVFDPNSMCAGGEPGRDTCNVSGVTFVQCDGIFTVWFELQKDGGAPLVGEDAQNNKYLLGVSSWGYGCGRAGYPGVYTNVTSLVPWIGSVTTYLTISGSTG